MMGIRIKTGGVLAIVLLVGGFFLAGCGNSAAELEMDNFLQSFDQKINELNESLAANDKDKTIAIEKEIMNMKNTWITKRNEYGDELTPQEMERMVMEFNRIVVRFNEVEKKKIG